MNNIPVLGWILDFVFKASLSVPFWVLWTKAGLGGKYFYFLPEVYLDPGFWNVVGVFILLGILKSFSPFDVTAAGGDAKAAGGSIA